LRDRAKARAMMSMFSSKDIISMERLFAPMAISMPISRLRLLTTIIVVLAMTKADIKRMNM